MKSLRQWKGGIVAAASIVLAAGSVYAAPGENLIRNGGFEDADEMPRVWDLFVEPHEGAWGGVESEGAAEGERCVFLETTTPYAQEPYNNWSQNILDDVAGKELVARATVKTEGAGEAVVWVQCWRREPWSMIKVFASSTDRRMTGTRDWTPLEWRVKVPDATDYLTVRCVLKGTGQAWFDGIRLEEPDESAPEEFSPRAAKPQEPEKPKAPARGPETQARKEQAEKESKPEPDKAPSPDSVSELLNANRVLLEGYEALKKTNQALAEQIRELQEESRALREELRKLLEEASRLEASGLETPEIVEEPPTEESPSELRPPPPLVPSGQVWKEGD